MDEERPYRDQMRPDRIPQRWQIEGEPSEAAPQPALTRCSGCGTLVAFLDGELCEGCR